MVEATCNCWLSSQGKIVLLQTLKTRVANNFIGMFINFQSYVTHCLSTFCLLLVYYNYKEMVAVDILKVFGTNLKKYRNNLGLSQEKFAEKCGLHRTYISDIECFKRSISLDNIQKIADALEIETYRLFKEDMENG